MLNFLFYSCVASLSLGQFAVITMVGDTKLYLFDLLIILFSIIGTFYFLIKDNKFKFSKFLLPFYLFCFIALMSLIYNFGKFTSEELVVAFSYLLRFFFYLSAANVVYSQVVIKKLNMKQIANTFILSGVLVALAGFIQLIILPDFTTLDPLLGWDPHKNRLASVFFDPNYVGAYFILVTSFLLFKNYFYTKGEQVLNKKYHTAALVVIVLAIGLTYSRSAWGMLGIALLIYGLFRSKWLVALSLLVAFLAYFAVPRIQTRLAGITDPADSAHFRLISWSNTFDIAKDNLFLGVGYNAFKKAQVDYGYLTPDTLKEHSATGSDSSLLLVLATTGIIGLVVFAGGLIFPILSTKSLYSLVFILPLILESNFVNSLFYPQILFLWLLLFVVMDYKRQKA